VTTFAKCSTCGEYAFMDKHKCHPLWEVYEDGYTEEDLREVHGMDARDAVETWAAQWDSDGDYGILRSGSPIKVYVRPKGEKEWQTFGVHGESVPTYSAREWK
jgi:hypothetical protein